MLKRSRRTSTLSLLPLLLLASCGIVETEVRTFDEERTYEHALFPTPEACEAAQSPDFYINCSQWMDFYSDGRVDVIVTDIINRGEYVIRGDRVTLQMEATPELPDRIDLTLSPDETTLTQLGSGKVWTRAEGLLDGVRSRSHGQ